jgi:hypothetical protein
MENVYVIVQGELFDSERIVSVHGTLAAAQRKAADLVEAERSEGMTYDANPNGTSWKAGGCYIRIQSYKVD